jgi:hypothetical protein
VCTVGASYSSRHVEEAVGVDVLFGVHSAVFRDDQRSFLHVITNDLGEKTVKNSHLSVTISRSIFAMDDDLKSSSK